MLIINFALSLSANQLLNLREYCNSPKGGLRSLARASFLHVADFHLSRRFGFLPPQLAEERRSDQRKALTRVVDTAIERNVDIVLVAGDLFDSIDPDPTDLEAVTTEFGRLTEAGKKVFAIPGNHDYIHPRSFWHELANRGIHVFMETEWNTTVLEDKGIAIAGIAFDKSNSSRRAFDGLALAGDLPTIVLVHASSETFSGQLQDYHPFSGNELLSTKAAYVALGHYHRFNIMSTGSTKACYSGTPEGIGFDPPETEDRFVIVGEIDDGGRLNLEPIKINNRVMRRLEIDCTSFESEASLLEAIRQHCAPNALIELRLVGNPNPELTTAFENLPDRFKNSCAYLSVNTDGLSAGREFPADDRTIQGRFCKYLQDQIESTSDPERQRLLRKALDLGLAVFGEA